MFKESFAIDRIFKYKKLNNKNGILEIVPLITAVGNMMTCDAQMLYLPTPWVYAD